MRVGRDTLVSVPYRVANAPVSFGAWSLESSRLPGVPEPARVLAEVAAAGYDGIELGPLGFLDPAEIAAHGLQLAGAYVPIPFGDGLGPLSETLDVFDAVAPAARPILADDGATTTPLDPDDVARAVDAARARGYEPTFHHHMGTRVETRAQIEELLGRVDVPLLLDTGHLAAAGVDPAIAVRDWRGRIDYVHVKDVDLGRLGAAEDWPSAWRANVFCELGTGDVDVRGFLAELDGYDGWLVVEQDWVPHPGDDPEAQIAAQARNRRFLGCAPT
jgi:inosose dehydratase